MQGDPSRDEPGTSPAGGCPKGVSHLPRSRGAVGSCEDPPQGGRGPPGHLRVGRARRVRLNVASEAIGRGSGRPTRSPGPSSPTRRGSGGSPPGPPPARPRPAPRRAEEIPPDPEALLTLFEVTVVGFWRDQAAQSDAGPGLDAAARRLAEAAQLVFWSPSSGHPTPPTRWPGWSPGGSTRRSAGPTWPGRSSTTTATTMAGRPLAGPPGRLPARPGVPRRGPFLYPELFEGDGDASGVGRPPLGERARGRPTLQRRQGPRSLSGPVEVGPPRRRRSHVEFVRLQAAYEEARDYCRIMGISSVYEEVERSSKSGTGSGSSRCLSPFRRADVETLVAGNGDRHLEDSEPVPVPSAPTPSRTPFQAGPA